MASSTPEASSPPILLPKIPPVCDAVQHVFSRLTEGDVWCADAMAALCRDRAEEIAAIPVPVAAPLVRGAVEAATRAISAGSASKQDDVLAALRHLLACPSLRDAAIKASRLKSLAVAAIEASGASDLPGADVAATATCQALHSAGVDIVMPGALDESIAPLISAIRHSFFGTAQVLLDAGADVNGLSPNGGGWPLMAAAIGRSGFGMTWLLARGASLSRVSGNGSTIAHVLSSAHASTDATSDEFCGRWLRCVITTVPSLLEACDGAGFTPLMAAAWTDSKAGVAALLALGADVAATDADGHTALSGTCFATSLPVVRQLIAASAASAAALPPGSPQARLLARAAITAALLSERGCGECAARCGGRYRGNCADGLDVLRAVLAAGVREPVGSDGRALGFAALSWMRSADAARRMSEGHALAILQALHAAGVDVLARGPADKLPVLHAAVEANASAVVRWLVAVAGAPLEERDSSGYTPLLVACRQKSWAAAHALLDCGARVDVQSTDAQGWWPVLHVAMAAADRDSCALLQRLLAADRDSLQRQASSGLRAVHMAAMVNTDALKLLLGSGLPHVAEAVSAVARAPIPGTPADTSVTPLHGACNNARWDAAVALLAAGARVDIAGYIDDRPQTMTEWARSSPACKHRGVKLAIAARAREHAAQAGRAGAGAAGFTPAADGAVSGGASAAPVGPVAAGGDTNGGAGAESADTAGKGATAGLAPARACASAAAGKAKRAQGHRSRKGATSNRAEDAVEEAASSTVAPPCVSAPFLASGACEAAQTAAAASPAASNACEEVPTAAALSAVLHACEEVPTPAAGATNCLNAPMGPVACALNLSEPSAAPAGDRAAPLIVPAASRHDAGAVAGCDNSCEPGAAAEASSNTCEPGAAADASFNTCEPGAVAEVGSNTCEPGAATTAADSNVCEPGEGMTSAGAAASTALLQTAEPGTGTGSAGTAGAALIASLQDEGASAAAVRRHLAALSELARVPPAAAALGSQGGTGVASAALSQHGAAVGRATYACALIVLLGAMSLAMALRSPAY